MQSGDRVDGIDEVDAFGGDTLRMLLEDGTDPSVEVCPRPEGGWSVDAPRRLETSEHPAVDRVRGGDVA